MCQYFLSLFFLVDVLVLICYDGLIFSSFVYVNGDGHLFLSYLVITFCETLEYGSRRLRVLVISSCCSG